MQCFDNFSSGRTLIAPKIFFGTQKLLGVSWFHIKIPKFLKTSANLNNFSPNCKTFCEFRIFLKFRDISTGVPWFTGWKLV